MKIWTIILTILGLWVSAVYVQSHIGNSALFGLKLDPIPILTTLVALRNRPAIGSLFGFVGGVFHGGAVGANLTAYSLSRATLGFAVAFVARTGIQINSLMTGLICLLGTIVCQIIFMFMAPSPDIGAFLGATIGTAIYNGVVAGVIDAILRRTIEKQVD